MKLVKTIVDGLSRFESKIRVSSEAEKEYTKPWVLGTVTVVSIAIESIGADWRLEMSLLVTLFADFFRVVTDIKHCLFHCRSGRLLLIMSIYFLMFSHLSYSSHLFLPQGRNSRLG